MANNIENLLLMMEEILDGAWSVPLSGGKSMVEADRLHELIEDIRLHLPVEISKAREIVNDRKVIMDDAKKEAEMIIRVAEERAKKLVDNDELVKQAQQKASEIMSTAQLQSRELKKAAGDYVDSVLKGCEEQLGKSLSEIRTKRQTLKSSKL